MDWKKAFRNEAITDSVDNQAVAETPEPDRSATAGSVESEAGTAYATSIIDDLQPDPQPGLVEQLLARVISLESRVDALEKPSEPEQVYAVVPPQVDPAPPVNVVPPTGPLVVKGIHYKDAVCDECGQVHDGTGRVMDTRGKLIRNPKKCSQQ